VRQLSASPLGCKKSGKTFENQAKYTFMSEEHLSLKIIIFISR
jgi:hypothetical protein